MSKDFLVYDDGHLEIIHKEFAPNNYWLFMYKIRRMNDEPISRKQVPFNEDCTDEEYDILYQEAVCMTLVGTEFEEESPLDFTRRMLGALHETTFSENMEE